MAPNVARGVILVSQFSLVELADVVATVLLYVEIEIQIPQVREPAKTFCSTCSRGGAKLLRTEPLQRW